MNYLLYIIATILWIPCTVLNLCIVLYKNRKKRGFLKVIGGYFGYTAVDIDRFGNHTFRTGLNVLMQRKGYQFGERWETISSALGKNEQFGTLTLFGQVIAFILNTIDKDHCQKSIKWKP